MNTYTIVQRAALVMAEHWVNTADLDADRNATCICGHWGEGDPGVVEGWDDHLAEALREAGLLISDGGMADEAQ